MVPLEIFGIGAGELFALIVLGFIFMGPEKLPELARKAARVVAYLRAVANNATGQLKEELGPEYADLTVADLNPKTFARKMVERELGGDLTEIKTELNEVRQDLGMVNKEVNQELSGARQVLEPSPATAVKTGTAAAAVAASSTATGSATEPNPSPTFESEASATGATLATEVAPAPFDDEAT